MSDIKLGCHVGMAGKDMFLASAREAASYGANVFMLYTGAPQNTRRKERCCTTNHISSNRLSSVSPSRLTVVSCSVH